MKFEILPNPRKDRDYIYTKKIINILSEFSDSEIFLPPFCATLEIDGVTFGTCACPDVIIVLGGDGSIMRAAHRAALFGSPILGINLGRVGFLAELDPEDIGMIRKIFSGEFRIEKRMMLEVQHMHEGKRNGRVAVALNDAVLSHGKVSKLVETELFCNGSSLGKYRSDGFVISTPTGSTAYSLSAGGPVIDPALKGICLVPICSHSLTARPIIVPDQAVVELKYLSSDGMNAYLTVDGEEAAELSAGDSVKITVSSLTADLIRINRDNNKNFYRILRDKMSDI